MDLSLINSENGNILSIDDPSFPIRSEFLVSSVQISNPIYIVYADDEDNEHEYNLPFVSQINEKYYYSLPNRFIKTILTESSTPTPTPSFVKCCENFDFTLFAEANTQSDFKNQLNFLSDVSGTLCWNSTGNFKSPVSYLISFGDDQFTDGGVQVSVSADLVDTHFVFTTSQGICYEGNLIAVAPHVNVFTTETTPTPTPSQTIPFFAEQPSETPTPTQTPTQTQTPTPLLEQSETPTPTDTFFEQEPIDDYIYDSMEATSITGGPDGNSSVGYNDRSLTTVQGVNGVTGLSIADNIVTLTESGRYYIKARSDAFRSEYIFTSIKFLSGDYADQNFDGPQRFASESYSDVVVTENSVVVDITQTTTFKIQTSVTKAKTYGLNHGGATLFVQKLANADGGGSSSGGGSSASKIIFSAKLDSMSSVWYGVNPTRNIPYSPDIDIYTGWDSTNNYWVAPKDMTVIAYSMNLFKPTDMNTANKFVVAQIRSDDRTHAYQSHDKSTSTGSHAYLNCTAVVSLKAGEYLANGIAMQGGSTTAHTQQFVITELGGGSSSSGGSSTFASLTDTPSELSAGKYIKVKDDGTGIEFVDAPSGNSSSGGIGSLEYLKNEYATGDVRMRFYTDLPDAIVTKDGDNGGAYWDMRFELSDIAIWDGKLYANYNRVGGNHSIWFDLNTTNGDYINDTAVDEDHLSDNASLRDYIEGGRAIYYGGSSSSASSTSSGGGISALQKFKEIIPVSSSIEIPDAILVQNANNSTSYLVLSLMNTNSNILGYECNNSATRWYIGFSVTDGSYVQNNADTNVVKEFDSLQEYISEGRAIYYGGGSSSSNGSSSSGIGNNSEIIEASNFAETLPDMIVVKNSLGQPVAGRFYEFSGTATTDLIKYSFNEYGGDSRMAYFKNDSTGSNAIFNAHFTSENASYYNNATSLQEVIDNGNAIYYGGSSSSGSSTTTTSSLPSVNHENFKNVYQLSTANENRAEFYSILPDFIIIGDGYQTETLYLHSISGPLVDYFTYQYQSIKPSTTNSTRNNVRFNTDANGTLWEATAGHTNPQGGIVLDMLLGYTSLKDFIDNGRAGYFSS